MPKKLFTEGNPGRPKGATGKVQRTVKETVLAVFNDLQKHPTANLRAWAIKRPELYYPIAAKLIPTEVRSEIFVPEGIKLQFLTDPGCKPMDEPLPERTNVVSVLSQFGNTPPTGINDQQTDSGNPGILGQ